MNGQKLLKIGLWIGRSLFPILLTTQCSLLVQYLVQYETPNYYCFYLALLLVLISWFFVLRLPSQQNDRIRWLWLIVLVYTWIVLTPMVGSIFAKIVMEDKLMTSTFFGPNVLKKTLCITPFLMLFILAEMQFPTANKPDKYQNLVSILSYTLIVDLFDGIEMLEVLLEEQQIPKALEVAIIVAVCGFFLLSPLELLQVKFLKKDGDYEIHQTAFFIRSALQGSVNVLFLLLRLALWLGFGRDAAIFMAKNVLLLMLIVRDVCRSGENSIDEPQNGSLARLPDRRLYIHV